MNIVGELQALIDKIEKFPQDRVLIEGRLKAELVEGIDHDEKLKIEYKINQINTAPTSPNARRNLYELKELVTA